MVRIASILCRIPVIRFRKGGVASPTGSAAAPSSMGGSSSSSAPTSSKSVQNQPASGMSTAISDTELPARYQRRPLSQEEIDHINGGGVV